LRFKIKRPGGLTKTRAMNEPATEGTGIPGKPGTSTPAFERALHLFSVFHLKITSFSAAKKGECEIL